MEFYQICTYNCDGEEINETYTIYATLDKACESVDKMIREDDENPEFKPLDREVVKKKIDEYKYVYYYDSGLTGRLYSIHKLTVVE